MIVKLLYLGFDHISLAGNFNIPSLNLGKQDITPTMWLHKQVAAAIKLSGLTEHVDDATRWYMDGKTSELDHLLTNG